MPEGLPSVSSIKSLLAKIDALIGLSASFPMRKVSIDVEDPTMEDLYAKLWSEVGSELADIREVGFPIGNPNLHRSLKTMWAWCVTSDGTWEDLRKRPHELYADTIEQLNALKDILSHADAPLEIQRELRESARRTNELFIIMAFRPETTLFKEQVVEPAARAVGLTPVIVNEQEPEEAISEAILSSIRRAVLVLCDLSFERPNCYFEAGFAKGAMRRLLFTCRADHNLRDQPAGSFKVHFDVDQFLITWWDPSNLAPARNEVEDRLRKLLEETGH